MRVDVSILDSRYSGLLFRHDSKNPTVSPVRVTKKFWFRKNEVSTKWAVVQPYISFEPYDVEYVWGVVEVFETQEEAENFLFAMNKGKKL